MNFKNNYLNQIDCHYLNNLIRFEKFIDIFETKNHSEHVTDIKQFHVGRVRGILLDTYRPIASIGLLSVQ